MMPLTMSAENEINYIKKVGGNSEVKRQRFQSRDQQRDGKQDHGLKEEEGK